VVEKNSDWQTKMFLLLCHESGHAKRTDFFHNGDWFIHKDGLAAIMKKVSKPQMEKKKEKRKICLLCAEEEFDVLTHEVKHYNEYEPYYKRERRLIIPAVDYYMHYYEVKIPFGAAKEKAMIEYIEKNVPANIYERERYYRDQIRELEILKRGSRKVRGHFLLCRRHSNEKGIGTALKKIIETSYYWQKEFRTTEQRYFHLSFPIDDDFLKGNYGLAEISIKVKFTAELETMIRNHAWLFGFDKLY
jgi:hypothetical protein